MNKDMFKFKLKTAILARTVLVILIVKIAETSGSQPDDQTLLSEFSIKSIHKYLDKGNNCSQVIDYFLQRAYTYNPKLNAIISFSSRVKAEALELDEGKSNALHSIRGQLHCVPVMVKDIVDVKSLPTSGGIKALRYSIPNQDALVVKRLRQEGALIVAKNNLAEMASGERQAN